MLLVVATFTLKSSAPDLSDAIRDLVTGSRAEDGCESYVAARSDENPLVVLTIEEWRDKDAFRAHAGTEHFARFSATFTPHVESQQVKIHTVEQTRVI